MIDEYFEHIAALLKLSPIVQSPSLTTERRDSTIGLVRGDVIFRDGSRLYFCENVCKQRRWLADRYMYVYHYQRPDGMLVFRYDNTEHYPDLAGFPHHKHGAGGDVIPANPPELESILHEIEILMVD